MFKVKLMYNIRDYGAGGNGITNDTLAIQKAVNACAAAGGGMVACPPGLYLTGTVVLRDNVELHVEAGATLKASADRAHYRSLSGRAHLVYAENARNIAVTGRGTIDGSGTRFFARRPGSRRMVVKNWRPYHMLAFVDCDGLLVRDTRLNDSPCYSLWALGCARVRIQGVNVTSNRWGPNTDGIDIDCCRDVFISDCCVDCGDDAIALKSDTHRLGRAAACENVTVVNCTLRTTSCGVRIGYEGDGPIRNCVFSNLVMRDTRTGIDLVVPRRVDDIFVIEHGPAIENISFSNLVLETQLGFHFSITEDAAPPGGIRGISIADSIVRTGNGCCIIGARRNPVRDIRFRNLDLAMASLRRSARLGEKSFPEPLPAWWWTYPVTPNAWFFRHVRGLVLDNVRVDWRAARGQWRSAVYAEEIQDMDVCNLVEDGVRPDKKYPALDLVNVRRASIRAARAAPGTGVYLRVAGRASGDVALSGSDLRFARYPAALGARAPAGALVVDGALVCQTPRKCNKNLPFASGDRGHVDPSVRGRKKTLKA